MLSKSFVLPFIGDGFDSLKDAILGALALRSQLVPLPCFFFCVVLPPTRKSIPSQVLFLMKQKPLGFCFFKKSTARWLRKWAFFALLHFLWLVFLSDFETFTLEMVGTALGCLGQNTVGWLMILKIRMTGKTDGTGGALLGVSCKSVGCGDVAWSTRLLGSDHVAGGCVLTSSHLLVVVVLCFVAWKEGVPRYSATNMAFIVFALSLLNFIGNGSQAWNFQHICTCA